MSTSARIEVRTLTGKIIPVQVDLSETVDILKHKIQEEEGYPPDQQRMVYGGMQLENGRRLTHYGIQNGSTLYLILRLRGQGHPECEICTNDIRASEYVDKSSAIPVIPAHASFIAEFTKNEGCRNFPSFSNMNGLICVAKNGLRVEGSVGLESNQEAHGMEFRRVIFTPSKVFMPLDVIDVWMNPAVVTNLNPEKSKPWGYCVEAMPKTQARFLVAGATPISLTLVFVQPQGKELHRQKVTFLRSKSLVFNELLKLVESCLSSMNHGNIERVEKTAFLVGTPIRIRISNDHDVWAKLVQDDEVFVTMTQAVQSSTPHSTSSSSSSSFSLSSSSSSSSSSMSS